MTDKYHNWAVVRLVGPALRQKATLRSVRVSETFESTAILADNFCIGVHDAYAEHKFH